MIKNLKIFGSDIRSRAGEWSRNPYFWWMIADIIISNFHELFAGMHSDLPIFNTYSAQGDLDYFFLDIGQIGRVIVAAWVMIMFPHIIPVVLTRKQILQLFIYFLLLCKDWVDYLLSKMEGVHTILGDFAILFCCLFVLEFLYDYFKKTQAT